MHERQSAKAAKQKHDLEVKLLRSYDSKMSNEKQTMRTVRAHLMNPFAQ